jgi:hypothetical protein
LVLSQQDSDASLIGADVCLFQRRVQIALQRVIYVTLSWYLKMLIVRLWQEVTYARYNANHENHPNDKEIQEEVYRSKNSVGAYHFEPAKIPYQSSEQR